MTPRSFHAAPSGRQFFLQGVRRRETPNDGVVRDAPAHGRLVRGFPRTTEVPRNRREPLSAQEPTPVRGRKAIGCGSASPDFDRFG